MGYEVLKQSAFRRGLVFQFFLRQRLHSRSSPACYFSAQRPHRCAWASGDPMRAGSDDGHTSPEVWMVASMCFSTALIAPPVELRS
jgi:hypothetical protein